MTGWTLAFLVVGAFVVPLAAAATVTAGHRWLVLLGLLIAVGGWVFVAATVEDTTEYEAHEYRLIFALVFLLVLAVWLLGVVVGRSVRRRHRD